jgi:hypothetical protein
MTKPAKIKWPDSGRLPKTSSTQESAIITFYLCPHGRLKYTTKT